VFSANNVFSTLGIPSDIRFTLAHFTFGTPVCTLSLLVVVLLVRQAAFSHGHFGYGRYSRYVWYTSCIFGTLIIRSLFSILRITHSLLVSFGTFGALWHSLRLVHRLVGLH